ncbi:putative spike protein [Cavally virus]|uniref:Putative spike protein n=1 Tax=Alphamesonivirus 1 (isolate Aedes harrisoni/Cote d'Ivoire/C79/2004) TaxID=1552985 RepID=F8RL31_AMV79|nr:putative spike protein [Cavally virus]AEH26446.1 putative spike protein [Cavally virus]
MINSICQLQFQTPTTPMPNQALRNKTGPPKILKPEMQWHQNHNANANSRSSSNQHSNLNNYHHQERQNKNATNLMLQHQRSLRLRKQLQQVPTTLKPMVNSIKSEKNSMLETIWDGGKMKRLAQQSSFYSNPKWHHELTKSTTVINLKTLTTTSILSVLAYLFKIQPLSAMQFTTIPNSLPKKKMSTFVNYPTPSMQSSCVHVKPLTLVHFLLLLLMLPNAHCSTRIDLSTHHIVSYNKPLIAVDDFLKTTLKYNFGTDLYNSAINYKTSFEQLLNNFKTPYQPLVDAFRVLFSYLGIEPVAHPFKDYLNADSPCPLHTKSSTGSLTIGEHFQKVLDDGEFELEPLASYWLRHTEDISIYTRSQLWAFICPSEFAQASIYLPTYTEAIFKVATTFCKTVTYDTTKNAQNAEICNKVNFITPEKALKRNKRWDSSYVCGWPLVSSAAKVLGGECTTNIDIGSLKSSLTAIQNFSYANTELIHDLQSQLSVVNARTNLHYNQLQQLVTAINDHQAKYVTDINNLINHIENTTNTLENRINVNSIIMSYTNSLFRVYQNIVDYRFAYIETLSSIQQHYHFPSEHLHAFNSPLQAKLKEHGFSIPIIDTNVPYSYGKVRYLNVTGINFYDLEFDIYIPVIKLIHEKDSKYFHSTLSALPIGINNTLVTYNTYQGNAICTDTYCLESPINGFCREGESYWYCGQHYIRTLHKITSLYTRPTKFTDSAMFIPPHTMYFVRNTTYSLNHGSSLQALAGSVLMLTCNSTVQIPGYSFNANDFVSCTDMNVNNVFIHPSLRVNDANFYIPPTRVDLLEKLYKRDITPILKHIHKADDITIDTTSDEELKQQYETLKNDVNAKYDALIIENRRIHALINSMHSIQPEASYVLYLVIAVIVFIVLKFLRII